MLGSGRGFGLAPRQGRGGRGPNRQQPSGDRWISVSTKAPSVRAVESLDGPIPLRREVVERKFNMYCALHLGHPSKTAPKKVEILRNLFNLVRMADETAAILPYLPSDTVNSVCHASHISEKIKDFEHYFPEVKYYHDKIRTKCRFSTTLPIDTIKNKIFGELRKHNYWIVPTSIKCHETKRCGFFLYAHPDFTHRHDFVETLKPIFKAQITNGQEFEFDVQPEKLTVNVGLSKFSEKVVMLRSTPTHTENVQQLLTELFSDDNEQDIKFLRKYIFVPIVIAGDNDRATLQGILRTQRNFRTNVYHYIVTNVNEFSLRFQVPIPDSYEDAVMEDATSSPDAQHQASDPTEKSTTDHDNGSAAKQDSEKQTEDYSLREWLYDLVDDNNDSLIHSAYPSAETNKVFILCEKAKAVQVLQILHNLVEITDQLFPNEAMLHYFGPNKDLVLVYNHPRPTAELSTYASKLAGYATMSNPQDAPASISTKADQRGPKRTRDGEVRQIQQSYAAAAQPNSIPNYGVDVNGLLAQLENNLQNLKEMDQRQKAHDEALIGIDNRFKQIEGGLDGHGWLLNTLSITQTQQGAMLKSLNTKIDHLTTHVTGKPPGNTNSTPLPLTQDPPTPNTSQGGQEGRAS